MNIGLLASNKLSSNSTFMPRKSPTFTGTGESDQELLPWDVVTAMVKSAEAKLPRPPLSKRIQHALAVAVSPLIKVKDAVFNFVDNWFHDKGDITLTDDTMT
jgi:hypothetical protein